MMKLSKNDQVILWSAEEDLRDQKYHQVLNKMHHLEEKYPDNGQIQLLMAQALFKLKKLSEAYQIVFSYRENLSEFPEYSIEIFQILLKSHAFMLVRELLATGIKDDSSDNWLQKIDREESIYRERFGQQLAEQTKAFAHLGALDAYQQVRMIDSGLKLPLAEYTIAAKAILSDPFGWQVTKTQILLELKAVGSNASVSLSWLDKQSYQVTIDKLKPLNQYPELVEAIRRVDQLYAAEDPIKYQLIEKELFTQSSYIYPFFDKVIQEPAFWVKMIAADLFGDQLEPAGETQRKMVAWIKQIHQAESFMKFV